MTVELSAETPVYSSTPHLLGTKPLWNKPGLKLPDYIENVAAGIMKGGLDKGRAISYAIAAIKRWASGMGKVSPAVRAASVKALAEWEALKATAHATTAATALAATLDALDFEAELELAEVTSQQAPGPTVGKNTGMIALDLPKATARKLPGKMSGHHVTLAFLGSDVTDDTHRRALRAAMRMAASNPPPIGTVGGAMSFPPGEDGTPQVVPVDSPGVDRMAGDLRDQGLNASTHGFHAHVTVGYGAPGDGPLPPVPATQVQFPTISVHRGGKSHTFPFTGTPMPDDAAASPTQYSLTRNDPTGSEGGSTNMTTEFAVSVARQKAALKKGAALPAAPGTGAAARFPITDEKSLVDATRMVQLANGPKAPIRKFIMRRAKALGLSHKIPSHWNADGTVPGETAMSLELAEAATMPDAIKDDANACAVYKKCIAKGMAPAVALMAAKKAMGASKTDGDSTPSAPPWAGGK